MKRLVFILTAFLLLPGIAGAAENSPRSLFVSMIQDPQVLSSRQSILELVQFCKNSRISIMYVQVYRANKAWFPSKIADTSLYRTGLKKIGEDPFTVLIREAHASHIQVHAWMNLLSLSGNEEAPLLKKYGVAILTQDRTSKKKLADYKIDNQYFLEPGDRRVRKELTGLVGEVLEAYPKLDGLQFDYIRYPDAHPETDPFIKERKRALVTHLLESLVKSSRAIRPKIQISTTGCMPYARAYEEAFQDWPSWLDRSLVDFVTVMDYSADPAEYERFLIDAKTRTKYPLKMNITVGAYKPATTPESFAKEWKICESSGCGSCVAFHYGNRNVIISAWNLKLPENSATR